MTLKNSTEKQGKRDTTKQYLISFFLLKFLVSLVYLVSGFRSHEKTSARFLWAPVSINYPSPTHSVCKGYGSYPSPTRSVCKDTVVDMLVIPCLHVIVLMNKLGEEFQ